MRLILNSSQRRGLLTLRASQFIRQVLAYQRVMTVNESTADGPHDPTGGNTDFFSDFTTKCIRSEDLLQGDREVVILHNQEPYRLLVTKNNKLILQK